MAKRHPEGPKSFWIGKRYEYLEKMPSQSALAWRWINSDCIDFFEMNGFIDVINYNTIEIANDFGHFDGERKDKFVKKEIDIFIRLWLEYRAIDGIIKRLERSEKYTRQNDDKYKEIFKVLDGAFDCEYSTFLNCIANADFQQLNIQRQNVVQHLTYRLSYEIDKKWYTEVCKNMGWKKTTCSGQEEKLKNDQGVKKLNKLLPIPEKE